MKQSVISKRKELEEQLSGLRDIVEEILAPIRDYDLYIRETDENFMEKGNNISTQELCNSLMGLSMELYYLNTFVETLSLSVDIAKTKRNDNYNSHMISDMGKVSIAHKQALAENMVISDELTLLCYQNAYKIAKGKLEKGYEIVNSIKKILNIREQEFQLTNSTQGRRYE